MDLYDDFKLGTPGSSVKRPVKQQKVESAPPASEQKNRPEMLFEDKNHECCVEIEVDMHVSESAVRQSVAPAEISFVSFETDELTGLSRGIVYVCFVHPEDAQKVIQATKLAKAVSASKFQRIMDYLNLRPRERSKDKERDRDRDRDRDRNRDRDRDKDRDKERERGREKRR